MLIKLSDAQQAFTQPAGEGSPLQLHVNPFCQITVDNGGKIMPASGVQPGPTAALTSGAGVPAAGTVDVTAAFSQAILNANFATLVTQVNTILTLLKNIGVSS